jgi:hypothetical protein
MDNIENEISEITNSTSDPSEHPAPVLDVEQVKAEIEEVTNKTADLERPSPLAGADPRERYFESQQPGGHVEPISSYDLQLNQRVVDTEQAAREVHDGSDGLPTYDDVVENEAAELIRANPKIFEALRLMANPGEAGYILGLMQRYPNAADLMAAGGVDYNNPQADHVDFLNSVSGVAGRYAQFLKDFGEAWRAVGKKGARPTPQYRRSRSKWDSMRVPDFERELDEFLGRT